MASTPTPIFKTPLGWGLDPTPRNDWTLTYQPYRNDPADSRRLYAYTNNLAVLGVFEERVGAEVVHCPIGSTSGPLERKNFATFDEAVAYAEATLVAMRLAWPG